MHATRGSIHTVTVPLPYPHVIPKAKLRTDQCAHARRARLRMLTRAGARPKRGRDSQADRAQAGGSAHGAQPEAQPQDETPAHAQAARTQSLGAQAEQEDRGGEGSSALLHRNAEIDMGYGPDEEKGSLGAGNTDEESDDGHDGANDMPDAYGRPEDREPEQASPHARQATASEQRAAAGISPGGRPVAPPGLGRLVSTVTPVGDMNGIDETAPGIVSHFWADDPECSSTSSSYPSSFFRRGAWPAAPPAPLPPSPPAAMHLLETPLPILMQIAPYAAPATGTASSGSRAISSAKLDRLMVSLRHSREAEALAKQAAEAAKAIKAEHHELRLGLHAYRQAHGLAGPSMQSKGRRRKPQTPSRKHMTEAENAHRDNGPDAAWVTLHERHAEASWRCTTYGASSA
jgi:hypothetical protein